MPTACAFESARAAWAMTLATSMGGNGPTRINVSESDSPSRYSITMYGRPKSLTP